MSEQVRVDDASDRREDAFYLTDGPRPMDLLNRFDHGLRTIAGTSPIIEQSERLLLFHMISIPMKLTELRPGTSTPIPAS